MNRLWKDFLNPIAAHRGAPFWSWNDQLDPAELVRQVGEMKAQGMGGFFMHSRDGLETEYMGSEWLECVRTTVQAAKEQGMHAWIYDEDRWPSGGAGGLVPARGGDAFRSKVLAMDMLPAGAEYQVEPSVRVLFRVKFTGDALQEVKRLDIDQPAMAGEGEQLLVFHRIVSGPHEWFNDDAPADNLSPEAVRAFIDTTYEVYKQEVGQEFGTTIPGVFTDEPGIGYAFIGEPTQLGNGYDQTTTRRWVPWTDGMVDYFRTKRGYDLLDVVPYLFLAGERTEKTRHDYWRTITERFVEAYSKQLGDWCEDNGIALTGHFMCEDWFDTATWFCGAIMPHYRYQQVPGIDMLCEQTMEDVAVKQVSSVAHQFGRKQVISETYGCTGWEFTFEGQKWVGEWQYVLGVTLRCQHLALYSLRGCRKRDYPPVFNYNTTWWPYNHVVEDHFARLGRMLTEGDPVRDVLVLHPVASAWMEMNDAAEQKQKAHHLGLEFSTFVRAALATHYDFDLGDETILAEVGSVEGHRLRVNQASYAAVVVPPMRTLFASTVELLTRLLAAGGRVLVVGDSPNCLEGEPAPSLEKLWAHPGVVRLSSVTALNTTLETLLPRKVSLTSAAGQQDAALLYQQRRWAEGQLLYVFNRDRDVKHNVQITLCGSGRVEEWDALTGTRKPVPVIVDNGLLSWIADFGPTDSRLYVVDETQKPVLAEELPQLTVPDLWENSGGSVAAFGPVFSFTRTAPNVLTLDTCDFRVACGEWSEELPVWQAQRRVREQLGMRQVFYNGLPQRYKWVNLSHPQDGAVVDFRLRFDLKVLPTTPVFLVIEGAEQFGITCNGQSILNTPVGWYLDRSFHKVLLSDLVLGSNELVLSCVYTEQMEVEDCFLIGDFGVDALTRQIVAEPTELHTGDWCLQGYPHYAGGMIYHLTYNYTPSARRITINLGQWSATTVVVRVNGTWVGHIPWRTVDGLDISEALHEGENQIDIEVVGSPRNMLGPLHQAVGHLPGTDWSSFRREGNLYTAQYVLHPYGLLAQVRLSAK